jgi:hypothetical protein
MRTELGRYSSARLDWLARQYEVPGDFMGPLINYLVWGFPPGSFFTALLANDFWSAASHSHPANRMVDIKNLVALVVHELPSIAAGSYSAVNSWCKLSDTERRDLLCKKNLVFTEQQETLLALMYSDLDQYQLNNLPEVYHGKLSSEFG